MPLFDLPRPDFLASGEKARLIPSVADTSKECRITSILLATMMSVEEFGKGLLNQLDVRVGKISKVQCFTEIVFKGEQQSKIRPDGLIIVKTGSREWRAIVECKVGKTDLDKDQVEAYLDLAKLHNIDAVITISNLSVADARHHPLQVSKVKTRNVALYHWSWMHIITEAIMWTKHYGISDSDQGYILTEFVRYLQHPNSGIISFDRMNAEWKDVCTAIQNGMTVNKTSKEATESVGSWHQFVRSLSLEMSVAVGRSVTVALRREYYSDPQKRLLDDCQKLSTQHTLESEFEVPDAASRIKFVADFKRRTISASMRLRAPEDRVRAKARVNWIFQQLKNCEDDTLLVKLILPSRIADTFITLGKLKSDVDSALADRTDVAPIAFEVIMTRDLASRYKGAQTFVQDSQATLLEFYNNIGQHLREWVASPPKLTITDPAKVIDGTIETPQEQSSHSAVEEHIKREAAASVAVND